MGPQVLPSTVGLVVHTVWLVVHTVGLVVSTVGFVVHTVVHLGGLAIRPL
jgi:hypothetical protein